MNNSFVSFIQFVFKCISYFFDCVVGNPGPSTWENFKITVISAVWWILASIVLFLSLFFIDKKSDLKSKQILIISIGNAFLVSLIYFAVIFLCIKGQSL